MAEVMRRMGVSGETGRALESRRGFHSASTMRHGPLWLLRGLIPDVTCPAPRPALSHTPTTTHPHTHPASERGGKEESG
eukprot:3485926-Rhodomonas_salina.1